MQSVSINKLDDMSTEKKINGESYTVYNDTLEDLDKLGEYKVIEMGSFYVAEIPLASFGYYFCSGVALNNYKKSGLIHSIPMDRGGNPEVLIRAVRKEMGVKYKDLKAVPMGVDDLENILKYLGKKKVSIPKFYREEDFFVDDWRTTACPRDMIVLPGWVFIYSHRGKKEIRL